MSEERAPARVDSIGSGTRTETAAREFLAAIRDDFNDWRSTRRPGKRRPRGSASNQRRLRRIIVRAAIVVAGLSTIAALSVAALFVWFLQTVPMDATDAERPASAIVLTASDGTPLGRVGAFKLSDAARSDFPEHLIDAVLSIEDRRFYRHHGVDPRGILRALQRNMQAGEIVQGGSTITQQLVKMRYLGAERSYARKLKEVLASVWLEGRLTKDEILTGYLNEVYLGANAQGMPAAARLYFDRNVSELSLSEAAMLAGLIRAPSQYNPLRDLDLAQRRANAVLQSMVANGVLSEAEAKRAAANPATLRHAATVSKAGGWFEDWAAGEAATLAGSFSGNVKVRTTLVPALQDLAETTIARMLDEVGPAHRISQAALVAMRPDGAVVAMVGGRDYQESQFNRAVQALRQPGSAFKLFVYLAALRSGYHADDVIDAGPLEVGDWSPENFGGRQYGRVTVADAFAQSINTATARLALDVGLDKVIEAARDLGIDATLPEHPSLALGAVEVSLLDLTGAYASVRSGLVPVEPFGILAIGGDSEDKLYAIDASSGVKEQLGQQPELIALLQRVVQAGTGRHAALDGFAAGKTGTSQNHRDAWFIGFSEDLVTGVWVGNDDGSPMDEVTGGSLPALIWKEFMTAAKPLAEATPVLATDESAPAFEEMIGTADGGSCDYQMCAAQYRSFRASDCTYQPFSGERRRCDIGSDGVAEAVAAEDLSEPDALVLSAEPDEEETVTLEPVATNDEPAVTGSLPEQPSRGLSPRSGGACNVAACAAKYSSFDPSNCTFQPFGDGPRQLCEFSSAESHARIGRDNTGDPLRHAEAVLRGRSADQSRPGRPPDACNVAVCAAFYSSFRAQDCTYQPFDGGPRRLCER